MQSHTVEIGPVDNRCRYWAKVVRASVTLPLPANCSSAYDIPGAVIKRGEEELLPGDVLFEGEANHHRRTDRGWTYDVSIVDVAGGLFRACSGEFGELRKRMKAAGMAPELLMGSGDIAAMARVGHAVRGGLLRAAQDVESQEDKQ